MLLNQSLEKFFESEETKVLAIKGAWGVGKTHAWREFVQSNKPKLMKFKSVSYVSLFGVTEIGTVRKYIISNKENLSESDQNNSWLKKGRKKLNEFFGGEKFDKAITETFKLKAAAEYYHSIIYHSMNNSIICIDDLERKSDDLKVDQILGLIDELVEVKDCKVVLIFNEQELDKLSDGIKYSEYREKIVDIEIEHNPSLDDVFDVHFNKEDPLIKSYPLIRSAAMDLVIQLDMKNIRVLRKIKWVVSEFWDLVGASDFDSLKKEFITNTTFLCWAYYTQKNDTGFDGYFESLTGTSKFSPHWLEMADEDVVETKASPQEALVRKLRIAPSIFDKHIVNFIKTGLVPKQAELANQMNETEKIIQRDLINAELTNIWNLYSDTFDDNLDEFKGKLTGMLDNHMENIYLNDIDAILDYVDDDMVDTYIDRYIEINADKFIFDEYSPSIGRIRNTKLREKVLKLVRDTSGITVDSVLERILAGGWNDTEIQHLASQTVSDIVKWMESNPDDLVKKIRRGWLSFKNNQDLPYRDITNNAVQALQIIAAKSPYNAKRVKNLYGIKPITETEVDSDSARFHDLDK